MRLKDKTIQVAFLSDLEGGRVRNLQIRNNTLPGESSSAVLRGELTDGSRFLTYGVEVDDRSEERRVGKECRSRWSPYH